MRSGGEKIHTCRDIKDADLKAHCQSAFEACKALGGDDYRASCAYQAQSCIDMYANDASSYPLQTPRKVPLTFFTPDACLSAAVRLTKNLGPIEGLPKNAPEPPEPGPPAGPKRRVPEGSESGRPEYGICEKAGPKDSDADKLCRERIGICLSSGPYDIPIGSHTMNYPDRDSCVRGVNRLSKRENAAKPAAVENRPAGDETPHADAAEPLKEESNSMPADEKTRFEVSFDYADFLPEIGSDNEFKTTLLARYNGDPRGLKIKLKYSLEETGDSRYRMQYTITGDDDKIFCSEKTIEFETKDSVITDDLAFAITLNEEGNFETAAEVVIVKR